MGKLSHAQSRFANHINCVFYALQEVGAERKVFDKHNSYLKMLLGSSFHHAKL